MNITRKTLIIGAEEPEPTSSIPIKILKMKNKGKKLSTKNTTIN